MSEDITKVEASIVLLTQELESLKQWINQELARIQTQVSSSRD